MKPARQIAAAAVAIGLAGCFTAEEPLLTDANSVAPYEQITFRERNSDDTSTLIRDGKVYLAVGDETNLSMRFMPLAEADWYVAEVSGETDGGVTRLYALLNVDLAANEARTYKAIGASADAGPGLRECDEGMICIDSLDAYVANARAAIDAGAEPDATYDIAVK